MTAGSETHVAGRLVVAAGPWTNDVLRHLGTALPLTVHREQVTYFATPHLDAFAPRRFPIWIWMDDPSFYGFPAFGEPATKAAQDVGGYPTTADGRSFERDEAGFERVRAFLAERLPRFGGPELYTKTCLYTLTPDRDFVIDTLPDAPGRGRRGGRRPCLQVRQPAGPDARAAGPRGRDTRRRPDGPRDRSPGPP